MWNSFREWLYLTWIDWTHKYCPVCRECMTCNLRPCRDGKPHLNKRKD